MDYQIIIIFPSFSHHFPQVLPILRQFKTPRHLFGALAVPGFNLFVAQGVPHGPKWPKIAKKKWKSPGGFPCKQMMWDLIMQSLGAACAAMSLAHHTFFWTSCESPLLLLTASHCSASAEQAKRDHTRSHNWLGDPIRISVSLPASNEFKKCLAIIVGRARWPNSSLRGTADCSEWVHSWTSTGRTRKSANMELGFGVFPNRWWGRVPLQRIFF